MLFDLPHFSFIGGDGAWSPRLITCFGRTFFDVALTRDHWLHHWVWLLGEEEEAQQYVYEMTAFKGNTKWVQQQQLTDACVGSEHILRIDRSVAV